MRPAAPAGARAGFTLLEMLVTLLIVGIALTAGTAAIARRDMAPTPLQAAGQMQSLLLRARGDAIRTGRDTAVAIDTGTRRYAYPPDAAASALPAGMEILVETGIVRDGRPHVAFRADGSSSGARIALTDEGLSEARLAVDWLTGLPRITEARRE